MERKKQTCLHCGRLVDHLYCSHCGQKITTSRFRMQQIFSTDFLHGVYNINPGILNTLKSLFVKPGHAIRDYVRGKRADFLNYFSFFILALTLLHFVQEYSHLYVEQLFVTKINRSLLVFNDNIIHNYSKLFALFMTPVVSFATYLTFRKAHQNFAEHIVLNIFKMGYSILIISLFYLLAIAFPNHTLLKILYVLFFLLQMAYEFMFYFQYFSPLGYTRTQIIIRSLFVMVFSTALLIDKWVIIF